MKKILKPAVLVSVIFSTLFITSCKEDETVAPNRTGTATIKGTVKGNFDRRGVDAADLEPAANVLVRVTYNNEDLSYKNNAEDFTIIKTTTTDAEGNFEIAVEARDRTITYTISLDDYVVEVQTDDEDEMRKFTYGGTTRSLISGQSAYVDLTYNDNGIVQ